MFETPMRIALHKAGLIPLAGSYREGSRYGEKSAISFKDPNDMTDAEIVEEVTKVRYDIAHIRSQLRDDADDGFKKGSDWRGRAKKALHPNTARLAQLETVGRVRRIIVLFPDMAEKMAVQQDEQVRVAQAQERKKLASEENHVANLRRQQEIVKVRIDAKVAAHQAMRQADDLNRTATEMFVKAAYSLLSVYECDRIWEKARAIFPNHPALADRQG